MKTEGGREALVTWEGIILDGRNRFKACSIAGVKPRLAEFKGTDPLAFVVSHNLRRRHLDESQRGMVAAKLANMKRVDTLKQNSDSSIDPSGAVTQTQAAAMLNVSVPTVKRSKKVITDGVQELQDMVTGGELSATAAFKVAKLPEAEQRKAVAGGVAGVREACRVTRK